MLSRVVAALREAPEAPRLRDRGAIARLYHGHRTQVLWGSMVGYALFYFCRKNLSVGLPLLARDLGYSNTELGLLGSLLYVTYGVSKFLSGLVADRANPRRFLVLGLVLSALVNLWFGWSSSLMVLGALWALNGVFQSTGAPASAKILATWFSASERGTKTAIWNISHQGGGGLVLIVAGVLASHFGWRGAFIGPALIALVGAALIARFLHDRPEAYGLPPVEEHRKDRAAHEDDARGQPFSRVLLERVFLNKRVWLVALASGCTYVVRYGALDWSPKYLFEVRGISIANAAFSASLLELIGIPGALLCGWLSDRVFGARRAPVTCVSLMLLAGSVWLLYRVPHDSPWLDTFMLGAVGFFTYGPQLLLAGVSPVDMSSKRVAAAAVGFTGLMSYIGATVSSSVTGLLLDTVGWSGAFDFWAVAALVAALLCVPLWHVGPGGVARR